VFNIYRVGERKKTCKTVVLQGLSFGYNPNGLTTSRKVRDMNLYTYTTTYQYVILVVKLLLRFSPKLLTFALFVFDFALSCNYFVLKIDYIFDITKY